MKTFVAVLALGAVMMLADHAQAEWKFIVDGNELEASCSDDHLVKQAWCMGYVVGITDRFRWEQQMTEQKDCVPDEVSHEQLMDVARKFIREHPETRHMPARTLVVQ